MAQRSEIAGDPVAPPNDRSVESPVLPAVALLLALSVDAANLWVHPAADPRLLRRLPRAGQQVRAVFTVLVAATRALALCRSYAVGRLPSAPSAERLRASLISEALGRGPSLRTPCGAGCVALCPVVVTAIVEGRTSVLLCAPCLAQLDMWRLTRRRRSAAGQPASRRSGRCPFRSTIHSSQRQACDRVELSRVESGRVKSSQVRIE